MFIAHLSRQKIPEWNTRRLGFASAADFCLANFITVIDDPNHEAGELAYYSVDYDDASLTYAFILINPNLAPGMRLWILWHEIAHFILHYPAAAKFSESTLSKADREANFVAAVAMMPAKLLIGQTIEEIAHAFEYPPEIVHIRYDIYKNEGI